MQTLKALRGHTYAQKFQHPGEIYVARDSDAKLLVLVGQAEYFTPEPEKIPEKALEQPKAKRPYVRRNLAADKPAGYSTKDMKSE